MLTGPLDYGSNISLACYVPMGNVYYDFKWYKGSVLNPELDSTSVSNSKVLTIHELSYEDEGIYVCQAIRYSVNYRPITTVNVTVKGTFFW